MRKALTDTLLRSLRKPASGRLELADASCRGLEFRITESGNRSWSYRYRAPVTGKLTRATIGPYPAVTLAAARAQADDLRKAVASGENPGETKRRTKAEAPGRTFDALADRYLAEYARREKRSADQDDRNLRLHVRPKWGDRDLGAIRRRDVIELVEGLIAAGKPTLANRVQSLVSGVFSFAVDSDLRDDNPCTRLKKRGTERIGERVLTDPEIRLFWHRAVMPPLSERTGLVLRLALLTGARPGEAARMAPLELTALDDSLTAVWTVPGSRTKNGRDHVIPLAPLAREAIKSNSQLESMTPHALAKAMARLAQELTGKTPAEKSWKANPPTPHDLRRTFRTRLPQLGVAPEIRDRLMNHWPSDVGSKHYDKYAYLDEKRAALNAWDASLRAMLEGGQ